MEIIFTKESKNAFEKEYKKALENKQETFMYSNREFLTEYAKYLIEYLEMKIK
jgi:hypothetical protein